MIESEVSGINVFITITYSMYDDVIKLHHHALLHSTFLSGFSVANSNSSMIPPLHVYIHLQITLSGAIIPPHTHTHTYTPSRNSCLKTCSINDAGHHILLARQKSTVLPGKRLVDIMSEPYLGYGRS